MEDQPLVGGGETAFSPERHQPICHVSEGGRSWGNHRFPHVKVPGVQLIVEHLPHLIPAAAGLGFLGWFWWHMRSAPPPDLDDQELAAWQEARSARRRRAKLER